MALDLCKYYKKQKFVSYNDGLTWQPLEEYERGELYEAHSASCGAGVFQYRWVLINNGYICDGKDRYTREIYQYSEDGQVWYNVFPTMYRKGTLVERNSPFCDNAGNGQYTSGDTDPTSGDTHPCPPNYIWNDVTEECVCNGKVNIYGECEPCPENYKYNMATDECECQGHFDDYGNCIICAKNEYWDETTKQCLCAGKRDEFGNCLGCPQNSDWNESQQQCVCHRWYEMRDGVCVYVDPLKTVKCGNSDGVLRQSDVNYYQSGWALLSYTIGDCIYRIDDNAFNGQVLMTGITVSDSVEEIGDFAFANCQNLKGIAFPSDIETIETNAFYGCIRLENVTFFGTPPATIPNNAFNYCYSLRNASWLNNSNITSIGDSAFDSCSELQNINLSSNLTSIGNYAFRLCDSIDNVTIPASVSYIGYGAFRSCRALTQVTINSDSTQEAKTILSPEYLERNSSNNGYIGLGEYFQENTKIEIDFQMTQAKGNAIIGDYGSNDNDDWRVFLNYDSQVNNLMNYDFLATRIQSNTGDWSKRFHIEIGNYYIKDLDSGSYIVQGTSKSSFTRPNQMYLFHMNGSQNTNNIDYGKIYSVKIWQNNTLVKDFIPWTDGKGNYGLFDKVSDIVYTSNGQLTGSSSTTEYVYYDNSIYIGDGAFSKCPTLTSVTINSDRVAFGSNVFDRDNRLLKLTFTSPIPFQISQGEFDNTNQCNIFVPCGSLEAYKTAWSQYADRIYCNDTGVYYRWVDDPGGVYCDGYDQYTRQKQQQTTNGITWTDNGVYRPIDFITHNSEECGYHNDVVLTVTNADGFTRYYEPCDSEPPHPSQNSKIFATYSYGNTDEKLCDGSSVLTRNEVKMSGETYSCTNMKTAIIGSCVTEIGASAFTDCENVKEITIPNTVTSIDNYAFYYCKFITSINIPSSVSTIGSHAFDYCSGATGSLVIPNSVTSIGQSAFQNCSGLTNVVIGNGITNIESNTFCYNTSVTSVTIPSTVTSIGSYAFGWNKSLNSINIPSVRTIGSGAFYYCPSITSITLGSSVTSIDSDAFSSCSGLTAFTINTTTPPTLGNYAFSSTPIQNGNGVIYVPAASVDAYKAKAGWKTYASKIQAIPNN